jgi:hypothetical protein
MSLFIATAVTVKSALFARLGRVESCGRSLDAETKDALPPETKLVSELSKMRKTAENAWLRRFCTRQHRPASRTTKARPRTLTASNSAESHCAKITSGILENGLPIVDISRPVDDQAATTVVTGTDQSIVGITMDGTFPSQCGKFTRSHAAHGQAVGVIQRQWALRSALRSDGRSAGLK